ncbi:kinase-like domain-containing protein [Suillus cothurnatus]|nr:kinase-like domain-containing protein [Suillus cothurnatus]
MRISYLSCSERSPIFPFEPEYLEHLHREWSPEFCPAPISDTTNDQRPGLVLLDSDVQPQSWAHVLTCVNIQQSDLGTSHGTILFKGIITKGYLMMREQPWRRFVVLFSLAANRLRAHYMDRSGLIITRPILITANPTRLIDMLNTMSLGNSKVYGMDPTMHMCNESCKNMQCEVGDQAIGWIEDKQRRKLLIISILWRSQGLFSRGTICYRVRDKDGVEYALKDCWVDEAKKDHEEKVLEIVRGIPNVVTLIAAWDVEYEGESDSTLRIRNRHGKFSPGFRCKYHRRMLLTPCGEPLSTFSSKRELISAFRDFVVAHKAMIGRNVLHGDLSPNNLIIHEGRGFFIDFDHAQIIAQGSTSVRSNGTGTVPYMSIRLLYAITAIARDKGLGNMMVEQTASDDLESLFYIFIEFVTSFDGPKGSRTDPKKADRWGEVMEGMGAAAAPYKSGLVLVPRRDNELMNRTTTYFGGVRDLVQAWRYRLLDADADQTRDGVTHEEIEEILNAWLDHDAIDEPRPLEEVPPAHH